MSSILAIDDDAVFLKFLNLLLSRKGFDVTACEDGNEGLSAALDKDYDIILSDVFMPGISGLELTREVRAAKPDQIVIIMSAGISTDGVEILDDAEKYGAHAVLKKEDVPKQLMGMINSALGST